eukprot:613425-Prorocentrum_minimum.AAC.1
MTPSINPNPPALARQSVPTNLTRSPHTTAFGASSSAPLFRRRSRESKTYRSQRTVCSSVKPPDHEAGTVQPRAESNKGTPRVDPNKGTRWGQIIKVNADNNNDTASLVESSTAEAKGELSVPVEVAQRAGIATGRVGGEGAREVDGSGGDSKGTSAPAPTTGGWEWQSITWRWWEWQKQKSMDEYATEALTGGASGAAPTEGTNNGADNNTPHTPLKQLKEAKNPKEGSETSTEATPPPPSGSSSSEEEEPPSSSSSSSDPSRFGREKLDSLVVVLAKVPLPPWIQGALTRSAADSIQGGLEEDTENAPLTAPPLAALWDPNSPGGLRPVGGPEGDE